MDWKASSRNISQSHHRESGGRHRIRRGATRASFAAGQKRQQRRDKEQENQSRTQDAAERNLRRCPEPAGVAGPELRAPQHHVEVIGDGREIAIHRRGGQRLQLLLDLLHAVGHHAVGDEVFAYIQRVQIALPQPFHQNPGIIRQTHRGARRQRSGWYRRESLQRKERLPRVCGGCSAETP